MEPKRCLINYKILHKIIICADKGTISEGGIEIADLQ